MWRALQRQDLPMRPPKTIKSAIQVLYSVLKPGVDGATQYLAQLRSTTLRYNWAQKVVLDTLFCLATNAVVLFRMLRVGTDWQGVQHFRRQCSDERPFIDGITDLCTAIVIKASCIAHHRRAPSASGRQRIDIPLRHRLKFFNSAAGRSIRLEDAGAHHVAVSDNRRRCVVCSRMCKKFCLRCSGDVTKRQVALCLVARGQTGVTCFDYFHSATTLGANIDRTV